MLPRAENGLGSFVFRECSPRFQETTAARSCNPTCASADDGQLWFDAIFRRSRQEVGRRVVLHFKVHLSQLVPWSNPQRFRLRHEPALSLYRPGQGEQPPEPGAWDLGSVGSGSVAGIGAALWAVHKAGATVRRLTSRSMQGADLCLCSGKLVTSPTCGSTLMTGMKLTTASKHMEFKTLLGYFQEVSCKASQQLSLTTSFPPTSGPTEHLTSSACYWRGGDRACNDNSKIDVCFCVEVVKDMINTTWIPPRDQHKVSVKGWPSHLDVRRFLSFLGSIFLERLDGAGSTLLQIPDCFWRALYLGGCFKT